MQIHSYIDHMQLHSYMHNFIKIRDPVCRETRRCILVFCCVENGDEKETASWKNEKNVIILWCC